jgi:hypothetical protein
MYILIVMFISIQATTGVPASYGVAMQEFSTIESCKAVIDLIKSKDERIVATCMRK